MIIFRQLIIKDFIQTTYNKGFYSKLKKVLNKTNNRERNKSNFSGNYLRNDIEEKNEDELLMENEELAMFANVDFGEDIEDSGEFELIDKKTDQYEFYD